MTPFDHSTPPDITTRRLVSLAVAGWLTAVGWLSAVTVSAAAAMDPAVARAAPAHDSTPPAGVQPASFLGATVPDDGPDARARRGSGIQRESAALPLTGPAPADPSAGKPAPATLADWRLLGAMLAAFAVLAALRFVGGRRDPALPPDVFEVLGTAALAGGHAARIVRFGPRTLLVAVSSGGCTTLAEISDAEATARIAAACRGASPRRGPSPTAVPPTSPDDAPLPKPPERPGRRIAAAAILCAACLPTAAAADGTLDAAANTPAAVVTTALERSDVPTRSDVLERSDVPRALTPLPAMASRPGEPPPPAEPRPASAGFEQALSPRMIETILPSALLFGVVSLVPAMLLMSTCFVRLSVVLLMLRQGLGAAQVPSNQILTSLAIFLSALVMWPVWTEAWRDGVEPYRQGELEPAAAFERGTLPIRRWMSAQIEAAGNRDTMLLFLSRHPAGQRQAATYDDVPLETLLPAFLVSELDTAFAIGFRMLLPFLVLDLLVATLVVSTGLVMLPPTLVSLPLKLLVFVAADGWTLVVRGLLDGVGLPAA